MLGVHGMGGAWGISVIEMRAQKRGGTWLIARMAISPRVLADYDTGWRRNWSISTEQARSFRRTSSLR